MKKIFLILCCVLYSFQLGSVSASVCSQSCKISDGPATVLIDYIDDVQTVEDNIIDALLDAEGDEAPSFPDRGSIVAGFNSIMNFTDYYGSFQYYIDIRPFNSIPSQVRRDHDLILNENKHLRELLKTSVARGRSGINVGEICEGIANCNLDNTTVQIALTELIKNNQQVLRFYRSLVTSNESTLGQTRYILTSDKFESEMRASYNASTLNACSKCAGEFGDVLKNIKNISGKFEGAASEIQNIKATWDFLWSGKNTRAYEVLEKELLTEYLESEGISTNQANIMLGNLKRANAGGGLSTSNPLTNGTRSVGEILGKTLESGSSFVNSYIKGFDELYGTRETLPYAELSRINSEVQASERIASAIATIYENEIPYVVVQDTDVQMLQARIIKMHFSLVRTSNMLFKRTPESEKLCKKQGKLLGRCQFDLFLR